jgi:hypothetical protein
VPPHTGAEGGSERDQGGQGVGQAGQTALHWTSKGALAAFLGDVFSLPASWPLSNVFSVGDILIALGIVWALHRICRSRLAHPAIARSRRSRGQGNASRMPQLGEVPERRAWPAAR